MQVQTKMMETWLPKFAGGKVDFTGVEKTKLFLGQMLQYGAAGVLFGDWAINFAARHAGIDTTEVDEDLVNYVRGGMMGWITGGEISAATRGAIAAGIQQTLDQIVLGNKPLWEVAVGAFGGIIKTEAKAIRTLMDIATADEPNAMDVAVGMAGLLDVVSTWKNARHALQFMMRKQAYLKSSGVAVPFDFSTREKIGALLGMQPQAIRDMNLVIETERERKENLDSLANRVLRLGNIMNTSRDDLETYNLMMSEIKLMFAGREQSTDAIQLMTIVHNKMVNGVGTEADIWRKAMIQSVDEVAASWEAAAVLNRLERE